MLIQISVLPELESVPNRAADEIALAQMKKKVALYSALHKRGEWLKHLEKVLSDWYSRFPVRRAGSASVRRVTEERHGAGGGAADICAPDVNLDEYEGL